MSNVDSIILGLKTRIYELTQNSKNYETLSYQYKKLQYDYSDLIKEKSKIEQAYESSVKNFNQSTIEMREEIEQLKQNAVEDKAEIEKLLKEKSKLTADIDVEYNKNNDLISIIKDLEERVYNLSNDNKELCYLKTHNEKEIIKLKQNYNDLSNTNIGHYNKVINLELSISQLKLELSESINLNNSLNDKYDKLSHEYNELEIEFNRLMSFYNTERDKANKLNEDNIKLYKQVTCQEEMLVNSNKLINDMQTQIKEKDIYNSKTQNDNYLLIEDNTKLYNEINLLKKQYDKIKFNNAKLCSELEKVAEDDFILDKRLRHCV